MSTPSEMEYLLRLSRPLPGRVILSVSPHPATIGSLHVPDSARDHTASRDALLPGKVLAVGYGPWRYRDDGKLRRHGGFSGPEELAVGDTVLFATTMEDLNKRVVVTDARKVAAKVAD